MGDVMVLVESEEEQVEEEVADEEEKIVAEEEADEREELPKGIRKHGRIHKVTALVNGNMEEMGHELQVFQGEPFFLKSTVLGCDQFPSMKPLSGESVFWFFLKAREDTRVC